MAADFSNVKTLFLNGRPVKDLYINGRKVWPRKVMVTFDTNITYSGSLYYLSEQIFPNGNPATPAAREVSAGSAVGALPTIGDTTYSLSGVSYTIKVSGWYTDRACTQEVSATWVPIADTTLYTKWVLNANTQLTRSAAGAVSYVLPKFVKKIVRAYVRGGGGASGANTNISAESGEICEVGLAGSGGWGAVVDNTALNKAISGGNTITLYAGAGGTNKGAGGTSYINLDNQRLSYKNAQGVTVEFTGNGGAGGATTENRYNLLDTSPEKNICDYNSTPCVGWQIYGKGATKIVSGHSKVGDISFQFYGNKGVWENPTPIHIRFYLDGSSTVWTSRANVGYYYFYTSGGDNEREYYTVRKYNSHNAVVRRATQSGAGCPGYGGYAISTGNTQNLTSQAGLAGQAFVILSS